LRGDESEVIEDPRGYRRWFRYMLLDDAGILGCYTHRAEALHRRERGHAIYRTENRYNPHDVGYDNPPDDYTIIWGGPIEWRDYVDEQQACRLHPHTAGTQTVEEALELVDIDPQLELEILL